MKPFTRALLIALLLLSPTVRADETTAVVEAIPGRRVEAQRGMRGSLPRVHAAPVARRDRDTRAHRATA